MIRAGRGGIYSRYPTERVIEIRLRLPPKSVLDVGHIASSVGGSAKPGGFHCMDQHLCSVFRAAYECERKGTDAIPRVFVPAENDGQTTDGKAPWLHVVHVIAIDLQLEVIRTIEPPQGRAASRCGGTQFVRRVDNQPQPMSVADATRLTMNGKPGLSGFCLTIGR